MALTYWDALTRQPASGFNFAEGLLGLFTKNKAEENLANAQAIAAQQDYARMQQTGNLANQNTNALLADASGGGGGEWYTPDTTPTPEGMAQAEATGFGTMLDSDPWGNPIGTTYDESWNPVTYPGQDNAIAGSNTTLEQSTPGVEDFTFNLPAAQRKAYEALQPFYDKLLSFAKGDLDLAKRILAYSYQQGMRESTQEYEQNIGALEDLFPEETAQLQTALNKRGVYFSGFGGKQRETLTGSQGRRRLAEERALQNRESRLKESKDVEGLKAQTDYEKAQFTSKREQEKEADTMATKEYGMAYDKYGTQLRKQEQEEARRVQGLANQATAGVLGGGGESGTSIGSTGTIGGVTGQIVDGNKIKGGWYDNPATGRNQRYWGGGNWTDK